MKNDYKNIYCVYVEEKDGKYIACGFKTTQTNNIAGFIRDNKNLISFNIFATKKEAEATRRHWNECYEKNGTYLLGNFSLF